MLRELLLKHLDAQDNDMHKMLAKVMGYCAQPTTNKDIEQIGEVLQVCVVKAAQVKKEKAELGAHLTRIGAAICRGIPYYEPKVIDQDTLAFTSCVPNVYYLNGDGVLAVIDEVETIDEEDRDFRDIVQLCTRVSDYIGEKLPAFGVSEVTSNTIWELDVVDPPEGLSKWDCVPGYYKWTYAGTVPQEVGAPPESDLDEQKRRVVATKCGLADHVNLLWKHPTAHDHYGIVIGKGEISLHDNTYYSPQTDDGGGVQDQGTILAHYGLDVDDLLSETASGGQLVPLPVEGENKCSVLVTKTDSGGGIFATSTGTASSLWDAPGGYLVTRSDIGRALVHYHA